MRRNHRVVTIAQALAANPGKSLPQLFSSWYDLKAAYNLLAHPEATPDELQATHRELVMEELNSPGTYLLTEDTTEMSWAGREPIEGLGPIGSSKDSKIGFLLHSTLAMRWPHISELTDGARRPVVGLIGVADQLYHIRLPRPEGEARSDHRARLSRERESQLWEKTTFRLGEKPESDSLRWVRVCDRGSDIYEFLLSCVNCGHGFVVRAASDRVLVSEEGERIGTLFETARQLAGLGEMKLELRGRDGKKGRTTHLKVSAREVILRSPQRPGKGAGSLPPVHCTVVRVWEEEPPKGEQALEWILLCDRVRTSFELARECVWQYSTRWMSEEFHKALKSGMGAEELQLESGEGLMAAIAIKSIVALRLLDLRERVRQYPQAEAEQSGLNEEELEVLEVKSGRKLKTVREVALALGRLGGHLNRKRDGLPGWITLWRGWTQLQVLVEGVRLAHKLKRFG